MEKQPTSLGETEDPEVLEATYNRKTHVFTTPPLFGGEQPWIQPAFLFASYRWHWSSLKEPCRGQGSSNYTETCYDPWTRTARSPALHKDQCLDARRVDSQVVLAYIKKNAQRFHVFVANWEQQIRNNSTPDKWKYIEVQWKSSKQNFGWCFPSRPGQLLMAQRTAFLMAARASKVEWQCKSWHLSRQSRGQESSSLCYGSSTWKDGNHFRMLGLHLPLAPGQGSCCHIYEVQSITPTKSQETATCSDEKKQRERH